MNAIAAPAFGELLRHWRRNRKLSQLELALDSDVSQRHLSFLESGRAQPSRDMILRLAEVLDMPLRERNALLSAAGFAPVYRERSLDGEGMETIRGALEAMLRHHEPFPALVVDRDWNLLLANSALLRIFGMLGNPDELWARTCGNGPHNVVRLTVHPDGLRPFIANWDEFAPQLIARTRRDAAATASPALLQLLDELQGDPDLPAEWHETDWSTPLTPVLPMQLCAGSLQLRLFSMISTFGTPQDITTDEVRVESLFPADADSERLLRRLGA